MFRSPIFWVLFLFTVGQLFPPTRKLLMSLLPTDRNLDVIATLAIVLVFITYVLWESLVAPIRKRRRKLREDRARMKALKERISQLLGYVLEWIGVDDPKLGALYRCCDTPKALESARQAFEIWAEARESYQVIESSFDLKNLPQFELVYQALVGRTDPNLTWAQLQERLENSNPQGKETRAIPAAARQLELARYQTTGDWKIGGVVSQNPIRPPEKGALDYIFDPKNSES